MRENTDFQLNCSCAPFINLCDIDVWLTRMDYGFWDWICQSHSEDRIQHHLKTDWVQKEYFGLFETDKSSLADTIHIRAEYWIWMSYNYDWSCISEGLSFENCNTQIGATERLEVFGNHGNLHFVLLQESYKLSSDELYLSHTQLYRV